MNIRLDLLAPETMKAVYQDLDEATGLEMSTVERNRILDSMHYVAGAYRANTGQSLVDTDAVVVVEYGQLNQ